MILPWIMGSFNCFECKIAKLSAVCAVRTILIIFDVESRVTHMYYVRACRVRVQPDSNGPRPHPYPHPRCLIERIPRVPALLYYSKFAHAHESVQA